MTQHRPWQDVLLGSTDQLDTSVVSPTMDEAIVDAARRQLLDPESAWDATQPAGYRARPSRPGMHGYVAEMTTQFIQEQVAKYGTRLGRTQAQVEAAEVAAAVRGIGPRWDETAPADFDPGDDYLTRNLRAEGWSERNAKVMRLVADIESGAV